MDMKQMPYVHLLQFRCRRCEQPIVISVVSEAANLEKIDADSHLVECQCLWSDDLLGVEAVRHWVTPQHDAQNMVNFLQGDRNERFANYP